MNKLKTLWKLIVGYAPDTFDLLWHVSVVGGYCAFMLAEVVIVMISLGVWMNKANAASYARFAPCIAICCAVSFACDWMRWTDSKRPTSAKPALTVVPPAPLPTVMAPKLNIVQVNPFAEVIVTGSGKPFPWEAWKDSTIRCIRGLGSVASDHRIRIHSGDRTWDVDARVGFDGAGESAPPLWGKLPNGSLTTIEVVNPKGESVRGVELAVSGLYTIEVAS